MSRGRGLAPTQSHIVSWTLHYGPVPAGMCVLHRCDVRVCVNPDHLFLGTRGDNGRDMAAKGRSPYGTRRWNARLTDDDIPLIRRLYRDGMGQTEIANLYGVKQGAIWGIVHGKTWRRVPDGSDDEARA